MENLKQSVDVAREQFKVKLGASSYIFFLVAFSASVLFPLAPQNRHSSTCDNLVRVRSQIRLIRILVISGLIWQFTASKTILNIVHHAFGFEVVCAHKRTFGCLEERHGSVPQRLLKLHLLSIFVIVTTLCHDGVPSLICRALSSD
jgi:hypothetical protein